jgi:hypothetical protein
MANLPLTWEELRDREGMEWEAWVGLSSARTVSEDSRTLGVWVQP